MNNSAVIDMRETKMEKKAKKRKKEKSPKRQAINLVISIVLLMFFYDMVIFLGMDLLNIKTDTNYIYLLGELSTGLTALTACLITKKHTGKSLLSAAKVKNFDWSVPAMLVVTSWAAGEVCDHIGGSILSHFMTVKPNAETPFSIIPVICSCIFAPLFEEMIFRFSFMGLLKENSGKAFTIIFTSVIFAAVHFYNIQGFGNVFAGAICMATVYYYTGNILYVMLEHAVHNALCQIDLYNINLFGSPIYYERNGFVLASVPWIIINAVILVLGIVWFVKHFMPKYCVKNTSEEAV